MDRDALKAQLEAVIYVAEEPVTLGQLEKALPEVTREELRAALEELVAAGRTPARRLEIRPVAGGHRMDPQTEHHQGGRRPAYPLPHLEGVPAALRVERCGGASHARGVRRAGAGFTGGARDVAGRRAAVGRQRGADGSRGGQCLNACKNFWRAPAR